MIEPGKYNKLEVYREVDFGVYLTDGELEVLLPKKYIPENTGNGDTLTVFVYLDSEDRPVATTATPKAAVGDIAFLKVKDVNRNGAFLDWGLEKDLLVPYREQHEKMVAGKSYVVKVLYDEVSGRIIASNRFHVLIKSLNDGVLKNGQEVDFIIYDEKEIGYQVIINGAYRGMLYKNELFKPVKIGDSFTGYVSRIRLDGKIDVRIGKPGFAAACAEKPVIIAKLQEAGGFLPFNSKSSPDEIRENFDMSKKTFKQAIGNLYKEKVIAITDEGIELIS